MLGTGFIPSENMTCHVEEFKVMVEFFFIRVVFVVQRCLCDCPLIDDKLFHNSVKLAMEMHSKG